MVFWIVAASLTLAACLVVLLPAVRRQPELTHDNEHDLAVYNDQLQELEKDVARGVINASEAAEARSEIGRRILKLSSQKQDESHSTQLGKVITTVAVLSIPLASWGIYAATGSPHLPAQPLQARLDKNPSDNTLDELIARAENHLSANPQDGRGWDVLAPIYFRVGRYDDSVIAYRNAIHLLGANATRETGLGEAIASASGGVITAEAHDAFERALALEPENPKARFLMAAALSQEGRQEEAKQALRKMQDELPLDSPWREAVARALQQTGENGQNLISDNEQAAFIEDMVKGLDQRLQENPDDLEGWQRLIHSYTVLGRQDEAVDALARGLHVFGSESDAGKSLISFAGARGISTKGQE